jgi:hypothetical protein
MFRGGLRHPFYGLDERPEECLLTETMAQHGVCERREDVEDDRHADEDLPARNVELVDLVGEPAYNAVVCEREGNCRCDSVVGTNVCEDCHLGCDLDGTPEKFPEERRNGSTAWPLDDGVEDELVACGVELAFTI